MNLPSNIATNNEKESFLKTRIDSLELPLDIFNKLIENNIITVRGLVNKSDIDLKKEFGFKDSQIDIINGALSELFVSVNLESQRIEARLKHKDDQQDDASQEISNIVSEEFASKDYNEIVTSFANHFGIEEEILIGSSRKKEIVRMRDIMVYVLREYANLSFPVIAMIIGNRDHTTVIHSFRKMQELEGSSKDFEIEFQSLILKSKDIKERKDQIDKSLISQLAVSLEKMEKDNIKALSQVEVPERSLQILGYYRQGLTLENIGKIHGVTRERARQIIIRTIKQMAFNESVDTGVHIDFETQLKKEKKIREDAIQSNKPVKEPKKYVRKYEWSLYYESCKVCGTKDIPHFRNGLCEECGNKSITGEAREKIINEHLRKCDLCDIPRDQAIREYKKDFYLSRKMKSVLCRKCFLDMTGKSLGGIRKNKWRMFYN